MASGKLNGAGCQDLPGANRVGLADADPLILPPGVGSAPELNGAAQEQPAGDASRPTTAELARIFDATVQENLRRGLLLTQRDVLINAIRDPRLEQRHRAILASLIEYTNTTSGMAFPGWRTLADVTSWYNAKWVERHYTEDGVGKTISELVEFGYLAAIRRAPVGGGRALSHYTIVKSSVEELQAQISSYISEIKQQQSGTKAKSGFRADPTPVGGDTDPTPAGGDSGPDPTYPRSIQPSDPTPVVPTVTRRKKEGTRREEVANAPPAPEEEDDPSVVEVHDSSKQDRRGADAPHGHQEAPSVAEVEINPRADGDKPNRRRRTTLAEAMEHDWSPGETGLHYAKQQGLTDDQTLAAFEKFKAHHLAKGSSMACWNAAWRTWVLREVEYAAKAAAAPGRGRSRFNAADYVN